MGDFNTTLAILDRSTRQKINKDIQDLNSDLEQVNLINIYRALHPKSTKYTFLSVWHHTYSKNDLIIGSKSLLSSCIAFHRFKWNIGWLLVCYFPPLFLRVSIVKHHCTAAWAIEQDSSKKKKKKWLCTVVYTCNPSTLGGPGEKIMRSGVQDQLGQHGGTQSLLKIQKLARCGGTHP